MKANFLFLFLFLKFSSALAQEQFEVFFDFNQSEISAVSQQKLDNWILNSKDARVLRIDGYCDWKGNKKYNDSLSLKRVEVVQSLLKKAGIPIADNYQEKGFGKDFEQSLVQAENRKVIVYFKKQKIEAAALASDNKEQTLTEIAKTIKIGAVLKLRTIHFRNRSAFILSDSKPALYELLCMLEEHPNLKIEIQGHICCQLTEDVENISTSRARAIYTFLVQNKINRKRLSYKGFGIQKPIHPIPEKTEAEAEENRRVEILILEN